MAFTRARDNLIITFASSYGGNPRDPSMFLLDVGLVELQDDGSDDELVYFKDSEVKVCELVPDDELEREKTRWQKLVIESLDSGDLSEAMHNVLVYRSLHDEGVGDYLSEISSNWSAIDPEADSKEILSGIESSGTGLKFNPETMAFSVSSIKTYERCPKQYELSQILRMPTRAAEDSTGVMMLGNFVHKVLEVAVKDKIASEDELNAIADELIQKAEWKGVDIEWVKPLLEVFWLRNKDRIKDNLFVEMRFTVPLDGFIFKGFIDRVDLLPGSENEVEIIDYKTGGEPGPEERAKQLLLYARGFNHLHPEYVVRRLSLDLLARDKPRVYELQDNGEYAGGRVKPLDMGVIEGMVGTARQIAHDYEHGFDKIDDAGVCRDCGFRLYCEGGEGVGVVL